MQSKPSKDSAWIYFPKSNNINEKLKEVKKVFSGNNFDYQKKLLIDYENDFLFSTPEEVFSEILQKDKLIFNKSDIIQTLQTPNSPKEFLVKENIIPYNYLDKDNNNLLHLSAMNLPSMNHKFILHLASEYKYDLLAKNISGFTPLRILSNNMKPTDKNFKKTIKILSELEKQALKEFTNVTIKQKIKIL